MPTADVFLDRTILGLIKRTDARSVCDYGCGSGSQLKRLDQKTAQRLRLTGIDFFSFWAKAERPADSASIRFVDRGSSEYRRLCARGRAFDLIVSTFALHHFKRPVEELAVLKKLLEPHGNLFLADLAFANDSDSQVAENLFSFLSEEFQAFRGKYHRHHYTPDEAKSLVTSAGFKVQRVHAVTVDFPAAERKEETGHALHHLSRMRAANRRTASASQRGYFDRRFAQMIQLVKRYGIDYSRLFAVTAQA
jgi:2-polyprenyl-3-methyl-5-hydroxy-6-metoxy-1,4-benzoquinol methylase